ncbi:MAG: hypothetical protein LBB65_08810 [Burkholderiales bacterium]|jgi:hypothetical protein|nr:hypothetical protein [Burkholderiales bacterium]
MYCATILPSWQQPTAATPTTPAPASRVREAVGSVGFSASLAYNPSLAIAPDGTLYVAYGDGGSSYKATVMRFDSGSNSWQAVGSVGFSAGIAYNTSLAIAPDGTPYVAYVDSGSGYKATVMRFDSVSNSWQAVGSAGFSAGDVNYTSLAIAPDGTPYVAYEDGGNGSKATVMRFLNASPSGARVGSVPALDPKALLMLALMVLLLGGAVVGGIGYRKH